MWELAPYNSLHAVSAELSLNPSSHIPPGILLCKIDSIPSLPCIKGLESSYVGPPPLQNSCTHSVYQLQLCYPKSVWGQVWINYSFPLQETSSSQNVLWLHLTPVLKAIISLFPYNSKQATSALWAVKPSSHIARVSFW